MGEINLAIAVTITIKLFYKYISDFIFYSERRYTESLFACL